MSGLLFIQVYGFHNLHLGDGKQFSRYFFIYIYSSSLGFSFFTPRLCVTVFTRRVSAFLVHVCSCVGHSLADAVCRLIAKIFARMSSTVWKTPCVGL